MEHQLQIERLTGEQRLVLLLFYWGEDGATSEAQIAEDLTDLLGEAWTRNRVHDVRRAAERRLKRSAGVLVGAGR